MATTTYTVTKSWALAVAGPVDVNLAAPGASALLYRVAASLPASTAVGHYIEARETHPVVVGVGENLYLRLPETASATSLSAIATDA